MSISLLDRISLPTTSTTTVGPVRSKPNRGGGSSPYNRNSRPPKGNVNGTWEHDLYHGSDAEPRSLSARLTNVPVGAPKMNFAGAERALREATGEKGLSIKGASSRGNVVQVSGLASGTTAADVEAIFKRCGPITASVLQNVVDPVVRLTFKYEKDAQAAVAKFHDQPADGRVLSVKIVGGVNASLSGRMGVAIQDGSVDVLMSDETTSGGSKLRSDEILATDSRAHVLIAPRAPIPPSMRRGLIVVVYADADGPGDGVAQHEWPSIGEGLVACESAGRCGRVIFTSMYQCAPFRFAFACFRLVLRVFVLLLFSHYSPMILESVSLGYL
ncbi:hypothetical protein A0H81_10517 [Grifola frondosa]|uniref:RRM domain-containing protein n=1 Tax=Grifola frondosa TaxID=5627 RepID=A0A1C7LZ60_GRIFR|nr:hypothetical protein A0H81_10517 [Grifola frondosa]